MCIRCVWTVILIGDIVLDLIALDLGLIALTGIEWYF